MAEFDFILATTVWGIASAIAVAALGVISLRGGRSRPRGALAFGLFALVWGLQIVTGNVAGATSSPALAHVLYMTALAFLVVTPYFLVEFAASQAPTEVKNGWLRWVRFLVPTVAAVAALLMFAAPELLFQGVSPAGARSIPRWGPLHVPLVTVPFFLSFALALVVLAQAKARAPTSRVADRIGTLFAGLGIYVGFSGGNNALVYFWLSFQDGGATFLSFALVFGTVAAITASLALSCLRAAARAADPRSRQRDRLLGGVLLGALALGAAEAVLVLGPAPNLQTVGVWRLVGVAIIAYGIARWRIYDLPQRAANVAAAATGTTAAVVTGAAAYGAGTVAASSAAVPVVAGLVVLVAAFLPSIHFARRLFGLDRIEAQRDLEESLYGQRLESYRAALEASLARGTLDEDQNFLAALRERFGITVAEERVLLHYAKSSVLVSRDKQAWSAYERLRLLGEGGGGRTWLARDRARDRLVVLKEPLAQWQQEPTAREAVLREARLAARVRHANVVAVEEVVEGKGSPIIVMEYLEGGSVADLLRARGTLRWHEAKGLAVDVLRGLEAVHAAGIVHRDVKPSNILLTGEGLAKIADFGIAVPTLGGNKTQIIDASATAVAGTLMYMAPEARLGVGTPDRRADLYGVAAVLHECLYGAPPSVNAPLVVRNDLPAGFPAVLARGLAERPEARYPSARAFADDLLRLP